jgi:UDP-N-acetylmuramoylalanine--D-glutamate ligase
MKIAILGYASQGIAALEYWGTDHNQLTVHDSRADLVLPDGVIGVLGPDYLKDLDQYDLIVRAAPSIHPSEIVAANSDAPQILDKVTTVTNEFFKVCPTKNIIGVTGTKGKGTTSTLITRLLEAAGKTVHLGGNIGIPPLDMLKAGIQADDWVVLELANFQLIDLEHSPTIAVCVMVAPEHLNWHADMDEYVIAKQQLFAHQTVHDTAVHNRSNAYSQQVASVSAAGNQLSYEVPGPDAPPQKTTGAYVRGDSIFVNDVEVCKTSDVALLGRHNLENVCAAVLTVWELIGKDPAIIKKVVTSFTGLEHRLELVADVKGVKYYDDSFGTTPETAIVAMQAFTQPKVIILGGASKDAEFETLAQVVASHNVRAAILIGDTAPLIKQALQTVGYSHVLDGGKDMTSIVNVAANQAQPGDVVLLSTACASFGLFNDYKDRGQQFRAVVTALASPVADQ